MHQKVTAIYGLYCIQAKSTGTEIPAAYFELLGTYAAVLKREMEWQRPYGKRSEPLEDIGYSIIDFAGGGIKKLILGATASVTGDFYGMLIFDLYPLEPDGSCILRTAALCTIDILRRGPALRQSWLR